MSEIWSKAPISARALDRMAVDTRGLLEHEPAGGSTRVVLGDFLLVFYPALEVLPRVHIDAEQHLGVLGAAVLGALSEKQAGALRLNPHRIHFVRDEVRLAGQARNPEAVHDVCRAKIDESWQAVAPVTHGHVQF